MDQRQPFAGAVIVEFRHVKSSMIKKIEIRGAAIWIEASRRDELVDVIETFVITGVNNHPAIFRDDRRGALVLKPSQSCALLWCRIRVVRIDLHHPAKAK